MLVAIEMFNALNALSEVSNISFESLSQGQVQGAGLCVLLCPALQG